MIEILCIGLFFKSSQWLIQYFLSSNWIHWRCVIKIILAACIFIMKSLADIVNFLVWILIAYRWSLFLRRPIYWLFTDKFANLIFKVLQLRFQVAHLSLVFSSLVQIFKVLFFRMIQIELWTVFSQLFFWIVLCIVGWIELSVILSYELIWSSWLFRHTSLICDKFSWCWIHPMLVLK